MEYRAIFKVWRLKVCNETFEFSLETEKNCESCIENLQNEKKSISFYTVSSTWLLNWKGSPLNMSFHYTIYVNVGHRLTLRKRGTVCVHVLHSLPVLPTVWHVSCLTTATAFCSHMPPHVEDFQEDFFPFGLCFDIFFQKDHVTDL